MTPVCHLKTKEFGLDEHRNLLFAEGSAPSKSGWSKKKTFPRCRKKISLRKTCFQLFASDLDVEKLLPETESPQMQRGKEVKMFALSKVTASAKQFLCLGNHVNSVIIICERKKNVFQGRVEGFLAQYHKITIRVGKI